MKLSLRTTQSDGLVRWARLWVALAMVAAMLSVARPAYAAGISVTTTADIIDAAGSCTAVTLAALPGPDGQTSLREAVCAANNNAGADTITFTVNGTFALTGAANEDNGGTGDLDIKGSLAIQGNGAANTIIAGSGIARIFDVFPPSAITFDLSNLAVQNGDTRATSFKEGGAIYLHNNVTTSISGSRIINNFAGANGAIENRGALTINDSLISGNQTIPTSGSVTGGGIHNAGALTINNTTISNNSVRGEGGGIFITVGIAVTANINNTTISGNSASVTGGGLGNGGGLATTGNQGTINITNSTISGNRADNNGGGAYFVTPAGQPGNATLTNVTVTNNTADNDNNSNGAGGGFAQNAAAVTLRNTLVAGNFNSTAATRDDISGAVVAASSYNLVGDGTGSTGIADGVNNNQVGSGASPVDPLLGPLANNGGPTETHALLGGSPAINTANNATCPSTDQRGVPRPSGSACDKGAYELNDSTLPDTTITANPTNPSNSATAAFTFTGSDNLTPAGSLTFQCQLDGGGFSACSSPRTYTGLADGSHTFQVRAIDAAGNVDPSPATYTWVIDTVAPDVTINQASGQADPTSISPIHFTVVFGEPVTGFANGDVTLSGTAGATTADVTEIAPNNSTTYDVAISGMTAGGTVIASVPANVANDAAGNGNAASSSTDNTVTFMSAIPDLTIAKSHTGDFNQGQIGAAYVITVTNTGTSPTVGTVSATDTLPSGLVATAISGTGWNCSLGTLTCTTSSSLAAGSSYPAITLTVNIAANAPASVTNIVQVSGGGETNTTNNTASDPTTILQDTTPPDTTIDSQPDNPSSSTDAAFTFHGTDDLTPAGGLAFECKLDGASFSSCASPQSYANLTPGSHTFQVRAIDASGNIDPTPASFTWSIQAATSLLYNGGQIVNVGSGFTPEAHLSSPASACVPGQTVSFSLDANPLTGAAGTYPLGTAITGGGGQATMSAINTSGWLEDIYTISAIFAGSANCVASSDSATLTVARPGNSATGGGWYTLSGSGRNNFGFTVRKVDNKCTSNCDYHGHLLLVNNGKWRLKGNLVAYSKTANGQGAASGTGDLYWWDTSLNGGLGDWALAQSGVSYTINFYDSGKAGKSSTDTFGIRIVYTPVAPQPGTLPNSTPQRLKGGDIRVQ